jgi:hypothetical protein
MDVTEEAAADWVCYEGQWSNGRGSDLRACCKHSDIDIWYVINLRPSASALGTSDKRRLSPRASDLIGDWLFLVAKWTIRFVKDLLSVARLLVHTCAWL